MPQGTVVKGSWDENLGKPRVNDVLKAITAVQVTLQSQ